MSTTPNQSKTDSNNYEYLKKNNSKEYVEELLQTWTTHSKSVSPNDSTLVGIGAEICLNLSKRNSFEALEVFLQRLPDIVEYQKHQDILRARISLALHKKQFDLVQDIIKSNVFDETEDILKKWDESHYGKEELRLQKTLTPLARFRLRKRFPPPTTICPSGIRKTASLPKNAIKVLRQWLAEHFNDPYPSGEEKIGLAKLSGLSPNQVKTWFANARRRIHKGSDFMTRLTDHGMHNISGVRSSHSDIHKHNNIFSRRGFSVDGTETNVLSQETSDQRNMQRSTNNEYDYERPMDASYRCIHSAHTAQAVRLHCEGHHVQSDGFMDNYISNGSSRYSPNVIGMAGALGMHHQTGGYLYSRWPYYPPLQYRCEEADAWQRGYGYGPDNQGRVLSSEPNGITERLGAPENGLMPLSMMDQYWQDNSFMSQEKAPAMTPVATAPPKDELTDVGAARILADLSSKQNWTLQCSFPLD
eukprot:gene18957-20863_t